MGRLGGSTSTFGYGRCNLSMAQKFEFARLLHSIGTDNNTLKRYLDFKMHANAKGKKIIQINAFICRRVVWNDEKMESIARINRFSIKHIFTVLWIIQSFFVPSVWCCNEKKRKIVQQCQDYQQLVSSESVLMCYYLSSEKMSLSLFLSVVTNHLIECTMNELKLKMDVTVHLITSAYDMGNKSTATTIQ